MSLVFILAYVGVKMLLAPHYKIDNLVSLAMIGGILAVGILASIVAARRDTAKLASPLAADMETLMTTTYRQARKIVIASATCRSRVASEGSVSSRSARIAAIAASV
jgi:tellurite resistance protein TerC